GVAEYAACFRATDAALAVDYDIGILIEFIQMLRYFAQRDQLRSGNFGDLVFAWLADIEKYEIVAPIDLRLHFGHVDFRFRHFWLLCGNPAELLIVDQFGNGGVRSASRTIRVFAKFQLAKVHSQGVVQQQAANQGLANSQNKLYSLRRLNQ